jgi:hypothetical protein
MLRFHRVAGPMLGNLIAKKLVDRPHCRRVGRLDVNDAAIGTSYGRVGVLPRAPRTAGGFRCYSDDAIARMLFVRNAIRLGFTTKELTSFLKARDCGRPPCASARTAGQRLLADMTNSWPA